MTFSSPHYQGHEKVVFARDPQTGLRAVVAVHSTKRGPALGGCRFWRYADDEAALADVLRLSRGMSLKATMAGLPFGGGKAVIIGDPRRDKTPALMRAFGDIVESIGGDYITGEDVGVGAADMALIGERTRHVMGQPPELGGSGDPSPSTALGCLEAIRACVARKLGKTSLTRVRIAVQGLGNVGERLARSLAAEGANLIVCDLETERARTIAADLDAKLALPADIIGADVDVYAPCALGGVLNDASLPALRAAIVAGAANNQLAEPRHGRMLHERGILYAPDYVANGGGMIQLAGEMHNWTRQEVDQRVRNIGAVLHEVFDAADQADLAPSDAADRLAEDRLSTGTRARAA